MIGAILGDIIGSPYEMDRGKKTKDFPLFSEKSRFTDDSVMTVAVGKAFWKIYKDNITDEEEMKKLVSKNLRFYGNKYPHAGYGGRFRLWLSDPSMPPYRSFGNGSAMRVSSVAWIFDDMEKVRKAGRISAEVTHNHPEGIKGAEAVAAAIFLARTGHDKGEIKAYTEKEFGYDLSRTLDEIRPDYHFDVTCQGSVPQAITAFLEGESFEDVVRNAVSLGGDTDTTGAIAGSIAEAFYPIEEKLLREAHRRLSEELAFEVWNFERNIAGKSLCMKCKQGVR